MVRNAVIAVILAGATLAGCATAEGYRQRMASYVGWSADALILDLGSPEARDTLSDGSEVWSFYDEQRHYSPGGYTSVPEERVVRFRDKKGRVRTRHETYYAQVYTPPSEWWSECETRFIVRDGIVSDFRFEGSGCVAEEIS